MSTQVPLLIHQRIALESQAKEVFMLGGIGTGKSHTGALWILNKISSTPKCKILMGANTYSQLMNATVASLVSVLEQYNIPFKKTLSGSKKRIEIFGSIIYLYSLENYESIRGIEIDYAYLDEACFAKSEAIQVVRGRLRGKVGTRQMLFTSSPNGYNWAYEQFANITKEEAAKRILIKCKTEDNIFLPEDYYPYLVELYGGLDNPLAKQELLGEFINLTAGAVYWGFDRNEHVKDCRLQPAIHTHIGVDFNIDNMNAINCQYIGDVLYVCKETHLSDKDANTFALAETLQNDLKHLPYRSIIPDSTGKARKTSSQKSDHEILRDAGFRLEVTNNPAIRDRQNSVNRMFKQGKIVIDPSCKNLISELEQLSKRDEEGKVSHISVALGYVVWKLQPIKKPQARTRTRQL